MKKNPYMSEVSVGREAYRENCFRLAQEGLEEARQLARGLRLVKALTRLAEALASKRMLWRDWREDTTMAYFGGEKNWYTNGQLSLPVKVVRQRGWGY